MIDVILILINKLKYVYANVPYLLTSCREHEQINVDLEIFLLSQLFLASK